MSETDKPVEYTGLLQTLKSGKPVTLSFYVEDFTRDDAEPVHCTQVISTALSNMTFVLPVARDKITKEILVGLTKQFVKNTLSLMDSLGIEDHKCLAFENDGNAKKSIEGLLNCNAAIQITITYDDLFVKQPAVHTPSADTPRRIRASTMCGND